MEELRTNNEIRADAESYVKSVRDKIDADSDNKLVLTSPYLEPWTYSVTIGELMLRELRWRIVAPNKNARLRVLQVAHQNNLLDWPDPGLSMIRMRPSNLFDPPSRADMIETLKNSIPGFVSIGDVIKIDGGWAVAVKDLVEVPESIKGYTLRGLYDEEIEDLPACTAYGIKNVSVSSPRIDAIAAKALKPSREQVKKHLDSGGVLLNYQPARKPGIELVEGDIVSVRSGGRFKFIEMTGVSKKGRNFIEIELLNGP